MSSENIDLNLKVNVDKGSVDDAKKEVRSIGDEAQRLTTKLKTALAVTAGSRSKDITDLRSKLGINATDIKVVEKTLKAYNTQLEVTKQKKDELDKARADVKNTNRRISNAEKRQATYEPDSSKYADYQKKIKDENALLEKQRAEVEKISGEYEKSRGKLSSLSTALNAYNAEYAKSEQYADDIFNKMGVTYTETSKFAAATKEANVGLSGAAAAAGKLASAENEANTANAQVTATATTVDNSLKGLINTYNQYSTALDTAEKEGKDVTDIQTKLSTTTEALNEKLKFDPSTASYPELIRNLNELKAAQTAIEKMNIPPNLEQAFTTITQKIYQSKAAISEYEKSFTEAANNTAQNADRMGGIVGRLKSVLSGIGMAAKAGFSSIGFGDLKNKFTSLQGAIDKVKSSFGKMVAESKRNFKHLLTNLTKYVFGFRSLFFLVRRLRKGVTEGIKNVVRYEKSIKALKDTKISGIEYKSVNQAINSLRSSLAYLKNAWGAAFAPIITTVTPLLTSLMDAIADAGNYIARFVGALTGQKVVLNATKGSAGDYAKGLDKVKDKEDDAADSAKKLNDRLADFDDLHVLGKDDDNGGSGSGNGGGNNNNNTGTNPNNMFYFVPGENSLADMIKDAWERANFMELGELLKDKIIDALDNIDWDALKSTLVKIGDSIGSFLQGILGDPKLFEKVGEAIGNTLNALSDGIEAFLSHTKKIDLGGNLAKGLNKFFATRDFLKVGKNVGSVIKQILDNIKSFVDTLDSDAVIKAIKDFIEGVNIPEVVGKVGELTLSVGKLIVNVVSGLVVDLSKALADNLYEVTTKGYKTTVNNVEVTLKPGVTADEDAWSAAVDAVLTRLGETITVPTLFSVGQLFNLNDTEVIQAGMIGLQSSLWDLYDAWAAVAKSIPGYRDIFTQWEKVGGTDEKRKKYREYELNWYKEHETAMKTSLAGELLYGKESVTQYKKQLEEKKKSLTGYEKEIEEILAKYPENQRERYRQAITDQVMKSKEEQLKQIKAMQNNVSTSAKMAWESYQRSAKTAMDNTNSEVKTGTETTTKTVDTNLKFSNTAAQSAWESYQRNAKTAMDNTNKTVKDGTETTSKTVDTNLKVSSTAAQQAWESYQRTAKTSVDTTNETVKTGTETTSTTVKTNLMASSTAAQSAWESYQRSAKDAMDNTNETVKTGTETTSTTIDTNSKPWCTAAQQAWEAYQRSSQTAMDTTNKTVDTGTNSMAQTVDTNVQKIPNSVETAWKDVDTATKENIPKVEETGKTGGTDIGSSIIEGLTAGIISLQPELTQALDNTNSTITTKVSEAKTTTSTATKEIETNISTTLTNINNDAFPKLDALKSKFIEIFNGIKDGIKTPINGVISLTESMVNKVIEGVNGLVKKLNDIPDIKFTNPDTNKEYKFGFKIPTLSKVSIPKLAQGAVIPPNKAFMAMLGDQSHGTNIEAPLDTIKQAVAEVMANNGNAEVIRLLQQLIGVVESKNLVIGDKEIGRANARYTNQQRIIRGTSF